MDTPLITAKDTNQFAQLSDSLKELPRAVADQVVSIKVELVGAIYKLKSSPGQNSVIYLPKHFVTQIMDQGDTVFVYAGEYHFVLDKVNNKIPHLHFIEF